MGKIEMNEIQVRIKEAFLKKLEDGKYKVVENPCLCGVQNDFLISSRDRYDIPLRTVMCMNCGLVRSDPYYDSNTIKLFYENEYRALYTGFYVASKDFFEEQERIGKKIIRYINKQADISLEGKKVFEVGCGAGGILKAFRREGCDVYGCDLGEEYLKKGKANGINLVNGDINSLKSFGKADIIILNHVLEHFLNPGEELKKIATLLEKNGILYISVPGLLSHRKSYGSLKLYLQNAHIYNFYLASLEMLLNRIGFKKISGNEKIKSIFIFNENIKTRKIPFLKKILIFLFLKLSYIL